MDDPIIQEIRDFREALLKRHNYDLDSVYQEIKEHERASGLVYINGVARPKNVFPDAAEPLLDIPKTIQDSTQE